VRKKSGNYFAGSNETGNGKGTVAIGLKYRKKRGGVLAHTEKGKKPEDRELEHKQSVEKMP